MAAGEDRNEDIARKHATTAERDAHGGQTSDRLRKDIDAGRAGDKVGFPDPAAAPLGTDDEAAGTPPNREQVRRAADAELGRPATAQAANQGRRPVTGGEGSARFRLRPLHWGVLAGTAIVVALGAAVALGV